MNHHSRHGGRRTRNWLWRKRGVVGAMVGLALAAAGAGELDPRGGQFIGFARFSAFAPSAGELPGEEVLTSPELAARIHWDELVASWNAEMPEGAYLKVEARALYPRRATKYYTMGLYSGNPSRHPRQSVRNQADADGVVATDTLILKEPCGRFQVRLTLGGDDRRPAGLKFLGLSLTDSKAAPPALPSNRAAWGKTIPVPERSQMAYSNGVVLCSPATVSMIMSFWSRILNRPELDPGVPEVAKAVYDPVWQGTGNWPFNTAYAGSYPGMRAYVTRLTDLAELEDWIAQGLPVGLSVCLNRLLGRQGPPSGHLVVCVGFTKEGDLVINDPGTRQNVRKVLPRKNVISAWAYSKNAVYLIYPENARLPEDRFGHWDSPASRQSIALRP
ncbi:MAG: C39 family peptidase [Verrucomicrobiota bacterium]